jgi:ankyrin repeat protein
VNIIEPILRRQLVDLEATTSEGLTVVQCAAIGNSALVLQKLFEAGADFNAQSNTGEKPLWFAKYWRSQNAVRWLEEMDINSTSSNYH